MVRLVAALSWFDEEPETLDRCVRAVGRFADAIVAVDGAYSRWPVEGTVSDPSQAAAIAEAAADTSTECLILTPQRRWAGQVEKRDVLMGIAARDADWVCVVDADHVVHGDPDTVRQELGASTMLVHAVPYTMPQPQGTRIEDVASSEWHRYNANQRVQIAHFFKGLPGFRVERHHWWYSGIFDNRRWCLWGEQDDRYPKAGCTDLRADYLVEHLALARDERHMLANRAYLNDREDVVLRLTGQEDDRPDLPRPVFDYTRLTNA